MALGKYIRGVEKCDKVVYDISQSIEEILHMNKNNAYAVITGASSGIGAEFAKRFASEGYPLVLVARREERLKELAKSLDTECIIIIADLSRESECLRLYQEMKEKSIAIFVNNAGFGACGSFLETKLENELHMIDVNVKAVHCLTKWMLNKMEKQKSGAILNVASSAGLMPAGPYMSTYYATKAYVTSLTSAVAEELRQKKSPVYIGCLCPGPVDTEFNDVAGASFTLKGIKVEECVSYAIAQMKKHKVLIVPTFVMKAASFFGRFIPRSLYIRVVSHQQKKKIDR